MLFGHTDTSSTYVNHPQSPQIYSVFYGKIYPTVEGRPGVEASLPNSHFIMSAKRFLCIASVNKIIEYPFSHRSRVFVCESIVAFK